MIQEPQAQQAAFVQLNSVRKKVNGWVFLTHLSAIGLNSPVWVWDSGRTSPSASPHLHSHPATPAHCNAHCGFQQTDLLLISHFDAFFLFFPFYLLPRLWTIATDGVSLLFYPSSPSCLTRLLSPLVVMKTDDSILEEWGHRDSTSHRGQLTNNNQDKQIKSAMAIVNRCIKEHYEFNNMKQIITKYYIHICNNILGNYSVFHNSASIHK